MGRKRHAAEEIVSKLRQVDVLTAQGRTVADAVRQIGVTEVTYYRWRSEDGGLKSDQVKRLKELEMENARLPSCLGSAAGEADPERGRLGKLVSPARRRACVDHVIATYGVSERLACRVLGQHRSTQRKISATPDDEATLTSDIIDLARQYGRYGYRRITALLRDACRLSVSFESQLSDGDSSTPVESGNRLDVLLTGVEPMTILDSKTGQLVTISMPGTSGDGQR